MSGTGLQVGLGIGRDQSENRFHDMPDHGADASPGQSGYDDVCHDGDWIQNDLPSMASRNVLFQ